MDLSNLDLTDRQSLRQWLKEQDIRDAVQVDDLLKQLAGTIIEELLEAERDEHLGYEKYDTNNKQTTDRRNGHSKKSVRTKHGDMEIKIPRDRDGDFEPVVVQKHERDISMLADKVLSLYRKGMTVRDIQAHVEDLYSAALSPTAISNLTDRILPQLETWKNRPLECVYAIVYIDGHRQHVRTNGQIKPKTVYAVMGIDLKGHKDILGLWIDETESAQTWAKVLTDLKNRGVSDILLLTSDDLPGIEQAVEGVFPDTTYQGCVVHVMRNSLKHVSWKDRKAFARNIKPIYQAPNEEAALMALDTLQKTWGEDYFLACQVWEKNWTRISTMFRFTDEIRRLIYTTNPIESYHRQLRKVTKNRSVFPDDGSVLKLLYLVTQDVIAKWSMPLVHWTRILAELSLHFGERVNDHV